MSKNSLPIVLPDEFEEQIFDNDNFEDLESLVYIPEKFDCMNLDDPNEI